jgi:SAM-dependent methyltransferase
MTINSIKNRLSPNTRRTLGRLQRRLLRLETSIVGGGKQRESALLKLLGLHYASQYRRDWELGEEEPHFFSQRLGFFEFAFGQSRIGPYSFYRGFFASEVLQDNDRLLDIGCGDGFFTRRFLSERCAHIDAVDIEPSAIEAARISNRAPNIAYHLLDAVNQPFPDVDYDVIVWDGALGHFARDTTDHMLEKIRVALNPEGVFVGSESLGLEGSDHLQFFHSLEDLYTLFRPYFKHIQLRKITYRTGFGAASFMREEGYWRCANDPKRLENAAWEDLGRMDRNEEDQLSKGANTNPS